MNNKLKPLESIQEFVFCHYHNNKSRQNFRLLLSVRYHSTFETFKQIVWNVICMRLRNPLIKQLYLWVICYHYSYQKITVQIRGLGHWYFHLICQGFFCSVRYCSLYLTYRANKIWWDVSPMPICALSLSLLYELTVISLELFGYFICLNSNSEFRLLPIKYFSTWLQYKVCRGASIFHFNASFFDVPSFSKISQSVG